MPFKLLQPAEEIHVLLGAWEGVNACEATLHSATQSQSSMPSRCSCHCPPAPFLQSARMTRPHLPLQVALNVLGVHVQWGA